MTIYGADGKLLSAISTAVRTMCEERIAKYAKHITHLSKHLITSRKYHTKLICYVKGKILFSVHIINDYTVN